MNRTLAASAALVSAAMLGAALIAGPLNPPSGPIASTYKTLTEVEPRIAVNATNTPGDATAAYIINAPGSYYLTSNLSTNLAATIRINAFGPVQLDLAGFQINALAANATAIVQNQSGALIVRNGGLVNFANGFSGFAGVGAPPVTFENVSFTGCLSSVALSGPLVLRGCEIFNTTSFNAVRGVSCGPGSVITGSTFQQPGNNDLVVGAQSLISGCTFQGGSSYTVIAGAGSTVENSTFTQGNTGLQATSAIVRDCTFSGFAVTAIEATFACTIERNNITTAGGGSASGILAGGNCEVRDNRILGTGSAVAGIQAGNGRNTIARNTVQNFAANGSGGIILNSAIGTNNSGNKIQDNELVGNWRNISVLAGYNLVVRNTMSFPGAGGNMFIVANNAYGPLINCNNTDLSTVTGANHPQANLAY